MSYLIFDFLRNKFSNSVLLNKVNVTAKSIYNAKPDLVCGTYPKYYQPVTNLITFPKDAIWGTSGEHNQWIRFDFQRRILISGITLQSSPICNYPTSYNIIVYNKFENKNINLIHIANNDLQDSSKQKNYFFQATITNNIKITFDNDKSSDNNNYIALYMIDFYGYLLPPPESCKNSQFLLKFVSLYISIFLIYK